mmetsp:Transcript_12254/g.37769  ORF Transcript_12254/g.37769 Transcript_12254/m.37769 type:complete len:245 (-) Transcript_12254:300-1034(-)
MPSSSQSGRRDGISGLARTSHSLITAGSRRTIVCTVGSDSGTAGADEIANSVLSAHARSGPTPLISECTNCDSCPPCDGGSSTPGATKMPGDAEGSMSASSRCIFASSTWLGFAWPPLDAPTVAACTIAGVTDVDGVLLCSPADAAERFLVTLFFSRLGCFTAAGCFTATPCLTAAGAAPCACPAAAVAGTLRYVAMYAARYRSNRPRTSAAASSGCDTERATACQSKAVPLAASTPPCCATAA